MNERYTYGYNIGWNVENEYINELVPLMEEYNKQSSVLKEINNDRNVIEADRRKINNVTEDQIREWYQRDQEGLNINFDTYKNLIYEDVEERRKKIELELDINQNKYVANLYYLITIKDQVRRNLNAKRKQLSIKLQEAKLQRSSISLQQEKVLALGENIDYAKLQELRKQYDSVYLEIRKLEHALEQVDEYWKEIDFTQEENNLMIRGLNPQQRRIFDEIDRTPKGIENPDEDLKTDDPDEDLEIDDPEEDIEIDDPEEDLETDDPEEDLETDDPEEDIEIDDPEEDLEIDDPEEDFDIDDSEKQVNDMYYDLHAILYEIGGNYKFNKFDNFVYKNKEIKCFNWKKVNERTFADKPLKLVRTVVGSVVLGAGKLVSNISYRISKTVRTKIDELMENVENLSEQKLDFLMKELTYTKFKENRGILPDVVWEALSRRMTKRVDFKVSIANVKLENLYNAIVSQYKKASDIKARIVNTNLTQEEKIQLQNELARISLNLCNNIKEFDNLFSSIDSLANTAGLYGMMENKRARKTKSVGGRNASDKDNPLQRKLAGKIGQEIQLAISSGDGIKAAEYFIYKEKIKIENTVNKRTLKNRFGKASVGAFEYSPYIELADYSHDEYLKTVIQTVIIISGIVNVVNQIQMKSEIARLNSEIAVKNVEIANVNQEITQLKNIFSKYTTNPDEFIEEYSVFIDKQISSMQGASEYLAMTAQASDKTSMLQSAGKIYNSTDDFQHVISSRLSRKLESIKNSQSLTLAQKTDKMGDILTKAQKNFQDVVITHSSRVQKYLNKYGSIEDFRALEQSLNLIGVGDPAYVSNLFNDLVSAARIVNNMQAINYINTINLNDNLIPAVVTLSGIVGIDVLEEYRRNKANNKDNLEEIEESKQKTKELIEQTEIEPHIKAKENFERKMEEWNEKSPFYKLIHKIEKPSLVEEEIKEIERRRGL